MPKRRDNDAERFARIEQLMEEYGIRHEDLKAYLASAKGQARRRHVESQFAIREARAALKGSKR